MEYGLLGAVFPRYLMMSLAVVFLSSCGDNLPTGTVIEMSDNNVQLQWRTYAFDKVQFVGRDDTIEIAVQDVGPEYESVFLDFARIDLRTAPRISMSVQSTSEVQIRVDLRDSDGNWTNADPVVHQLEPADIFTTLVYDYAGRFGQVWPGDANVSPTSIVGLALMVNPGSQQGFTGRLVIKELRVGSAVSALQ